ncbi:MAG: homoserine dehydrogenase [Actinobacteria bacterium]|nr:homoserine dehydrogenase [Actinomycetota bacterium]
MRTVKLALFGLGTVGSGVVKILQSHKEDFRRHVGVDVELVACTSRVRDEAVNLGIADMFTTAEAIFDNPEIDIVIELIGGTGFAREVVERSLRSGKHVVTANKALMASCGGELLALAAERNVNLAFEASVGGGIPIISPMKHSLISNEISAVLGIVNGTTNYMLTKMDQEGLTYDDALEDARRKGFAEADPSADVDGYDAAAKIAILASIAFNTRVTIDDVIPEGIRSITPADLVNAREMGYAIKLLAIARRTEDGIDIRVHPTMLPLSHPLASVNGVYNAIYVIGDSVGETMFFGEGAGSGPAASAVVGDVLEVARLINAGVGPIVGCTCTDSLPIRPMSELVTKYYIRLSVIDQPGVLAATSAVFGNHGVSIYSMIQRGSFAGSADLIYVTHRANEANMMAALKEIAKLDTVNEVAAIIRLED